MSNFGEYRESKNRESREREEVMEFEKRTGSQRWDQFQRFLSKEIAGMRIGQKRLILSDHKLVLGAYMTARFDIVHQVFGRSGPTEYLVIFENGSSFLTRKELGRWPVFLARLPGGEWGWRMKNGDILADDDLGVAVVRHLEELTQKHGDRLL